MNFTYIFYSSAIHIVFHLIECPSLDDIPNGSVSLSGNTTGDIAVYTCDDGFELVGDPTRVCMNDTTWSGEPPTCRRKLKQQCYTL